MISPGLFRMLFAGLVVLHHSTPLRLGGWAVLVFFVLSGYWISKMWEDKYAQAKSPILTFIISRWWRLFPVMASSIVLYFLWAGGMQGYSWGWVIRQFPIIGSTWRGTPLPPQWSLDVEMQFYLAFVAAVFFLRTAAGGRVDCSALWLALGAMGIGYAAWYLAAGGSMELPYLGPWLGLFCAGIGLHKSGWVPAQRSALICAAAFLAGTLVILVRPETRSAVWISGSSASALQAAGTYFPYHWPHLWLLLGILLFVPYLAVNVRQPSSPWDREMGNLAYPVYMFHWIPREWYYSNVDWSRSLWFNGLLLGINVCGAFAGGWLIYKLIDKPVERMRAKWLSSRVSRSSAAA